MTQLQELKDRLCSVADLGPAGPLPLIYERYGPQKTTIYYVKGLVETIIYYVKWVVVTI